MTPWVVLYGHRPMYCTNDDRDDCTKFETRTRTGIPMLKMWGMEVMTHYANSTFEVILSRKSLPSMVLT